MKHCVTKRNVTMIADAVLLVPLLVCSESDDRVNHRFTSASPRALSLRDPTKPSLWSMANGRAWKQRLFTEASRQPNKNVSTLVHSLNGRLLLGLQLQHSKERSSSHKRAENGLRLLRKTVITQRAWSLTWSHVKMVEELLERFSAVVSDVCACLMGFKVRLDHFLREKLIWDLNRLINCLRPNDSY